MRGLFLLCGLCAASATQAYAATDVETKTERLDSVVVSASRAGKSTPVTFTMVGKDDLRKVSQMSSIPMALSLQPSVVTTNEGGTGLGYSKMTVRGSKGSQINVTLNGITLNDAESQEVFWVNIPALSSILSSVQLQRGLGTSSNGAGAFGASLNMSTSSVSTAPHGYFNIGRGSFGTMTTTLSAGTGLTKSGLYVNAAYSRDYTDGYIRNAKAKVQSGFAVLGWLKGNNSIRLTYLYGNQHTGITWNGIPMATYLTDRKHNSAGEYYDQYGNVHYYDNETDNYTQHHIQLNYTRQFGDALTWSTTYNFTKGDGYYEQYEAGEKFGDYGFKNPIYDGQEVEKGDFIVQKAMDNGYHVVNSNLKYTSPILDIVGGVNLSLYNGDHFGDVLWNNILGDSYDYDSYNASHSWYLNHGRKREANAFARAEYRPVEWLTAYADLQYRGVFLNMHGPDDNGSMLDYDKSWNFFNPRIGATFSWSRAQKAYVSAAIGHREPGRSDLKESIETANDLIASGKEGKVGLRPEKMLDIEIGYTYTGDKFSGSANIYMMEYKDMLLETGKLSDVGYALKENVDRSWRRGIELAAAYRPLRWLDINANLTLSTNKIKDYSAYVEVYDNLDDWNFVRQDEDHIGKTTMLMSPSVTGMAKISVHPFRTFASGSLKTTAISLSGKYVGSQYWDNTEDDSRKIPAYFVSDLAVSHDFNVGGGILGLKAFVNNLFNNMYYADAWVYRARFIKENYNYQEEGVFPQAPVNFMFGVTYSF